MTDWFSINEACAYLGCSRQTLYRELRRGALRPDGRVRGRWRFRKETLDDYVTSCIAVDSCASVPPRLERLAGEEVAHATKAAAAQANEGARHLRNEDGTFLVRITWNDPRTGIRKKREQTVDTMQEALAIRAEPRGEVKKPSRESLRDFVTRWADEHMKRLEPSTKERYVQAVARLSMELGDVYVDALTPSDVRQMLDRARDEFAPRRSTGGCRCSGSRSTWPSRKARWFRTRHDGRGRCPRRGRRANGRCRSGRTSFIVSWRRPRRSRTGAPVTRRVGEHRRAGNLHRRRRKGSGRRPWLGHEAGGGPGPKCSSLCYSFGAKARDEHPTRCLNA